MAFAVQSFAQADLVLTKSCSDTMKFADPVKTYYIIHYTFKNKGPQALTAGSDKIMLKTPSGTHTLNLPAASSNPPWPGGLPKDSTVVWNDTLGWKSAPGTPSWQWCDSLWAVNSSSAVITDPNIADNKTCKTIWFKVDPAASVGTLAGAENGLSVYPNPASTQVNVKYNFAGSNSNSIMVTDLLGKVVYAKDLGSKLYGERTYQIDASQFAKGMYIITLAVDNARLVSKVTVD